MRTTVLRAFLGLALAVPLPAVAENFWDWAADGMRLSHIDHPRIDSWEQRIRSRPTLWNVTLSQGRAFLFPIATVIEQHRLPMEIALIPAIESEFDGHANSSAGAGGFWQVIPATAARLGLEHDWWHDQRADLLSSSDAAARYLSYLHGRFDDWLLAMAAYNAGESRVAAAIRRNRKAGLATDFWSLDLPGEARDYVPKILALARVVRSPGSMRLPFVENRGTYSTVDTGGPIDLELAARLSRTSLGTIYRLNPQLKRWALPPDGPYRLYLPSSAADHFRAELARLGPSQRTQWVRHRVRAGDTLGALSIKHETSVALIRRCNGLKDNIIIVGQELLIPARASTLGSQTITAARLRGRLPYAQDAPEPGVHIVRRGESLWHIARNNELSVERLAQFNNLSKGATLVPGQRLLVRAPDERTLVYVVRPGDALSRIARRFKVRVHDIRRWNDLGREMLVPGQHLTLFLESGPAS